MRRDEGHHTRGEQRMNSRVPVRIQWIEDGQPRTIEAQTIDTSASGCFLLAPQSLLVCQHVRVVNLVNGTECEGTVVRQGQHKSECWELGIKLQCPPREFWGLDW
jgi:hypothetical protein